MKKRIFLIMFLIISSYMFSGTRSLNEAELVCQNFLQLKNKDLAVTSQYIYDNEEITLYYFNFENDGFAIVNADDRSYPLVAYSWHGNYSPANSEDLQFEFIKEDLKKRNGFYRSSSRFVENNQDTWEKLLRGVRPERTFQQWPMEGNTITDGWCETQWTQSGIFNQFCPLDNTGNRSVVGCVATAMAQIMHFHEYIGEPEFNNSDDYYSGWWDPIHIDNDHEENDFPDWNELNGYLESVVEHYNSGELLTNQDLAALNYACGVSVEMNYNSQGSGANTESVASALNYKFDYNSAIWTDNYGSSFYNNIAVNMKEMKPCEFSIYTSGWNDGHAIVCDGYNTDNYFHLNYGWGSSNIGWYYLPEGMPSNYTIIGGAVHNIEGGEHPVSVSGSIYGPVELEDIYVLFDGETYSYEAYSNDNGEFIVPALKPDWYTISAVSGRIWFVEEEIYINSNISSLELQMYNYESLEGYIISPIQDEGTVIALYQDDDLIAQTVVGINGTFSIQDILPGDYYITGTLNSDWYGYTYFTYDQDNQTVQFPIMEYNLDHNINWSDEPVDTFSLIPIDISCGIKIPSEDLIDYQNYLFKGVSFISPISTEDGSLTASLWRGEELIAELPVDDFSYGEEVYAEFPIYNQIQSDQDYFIGYQLNSLTGDIAWHDDGPRISGKGAWFKVAGWTEIASFFDFNFCISADLIGTVTGNDDPDLIESANHFISVIPNPFRSEIRRKSASIKFSLTETADTQITLYNIKGQRIDEVFHDTMSCGKHYVRWKPKNLSSGIYFYQLKVNGKPVDHIKTLMIK